MELDGAKHCFSFLEEKGVEINKFISDRHAGNVFFCQIIVFLNLSANII